jgi:hypothetical protein
MPGKFEGDTCPFCKRGTLSWQDQELAFHQRTSKGYVFCRVTVGVGICNSCGLKSLTDVAEAMIEDAVRREFEKLP